MLAVRWTAAIAGLAACATSDPNRYYDPNALEKTGRVTQRKIVAVEFRDSCPDAVPPPYAYGLPANAVAYVTYAVLRELSRKESRIPIYAYLIGTGEPNPVLVYSEFPGHEVGECVKVFISDRPDYPRMTSWSGCPRDSAPTHAPERPNS